MARIRTIKPEFWEDEKTAKLNAITALTYLGLISLADDEGIGRGDSAWLASRLHGIRPRTPRQVVTKSISTLHQLRLAIFYKHKDENGITQTYYWIPKFYKNQYIQKPKKSEFPKPPDYHIDIVKVSSGMEGNGKERKGREEEKPAAPESSQVIKALEKGFEGHPKPGKLESSPKDQVESHLFKLAKKCNIPNKDDTLRKYLKSWIARASAKEVERVLMLKEIQGLNVLQIDKAFFGGDKTPQQSAEELMRKFKLKEAK